MVDLSLVIVFTLIGWVLQAWAMAWAARKVGAKRASLAIGFLAIIIGLLIGCASLLVTHALSSIVDTESQRVAAIATLVVACVIDFAAWRSLFGLSWKATFAPVGAYLAVPLIEVAAIVAIFRPFVMEAFVIPVPSMAPTIEPGGRIVVNKLIHPRRWDIVAYHVPQDGNHIYCKRLIGLPGERLFFNHGSLYINGQFMAAPTVLEGRMRSSLTQDSQYFPPHSDGESITLGPNEFFTIGDNSDRSLDSRYYGPSKMSALVGVADLIYWPINRFEILR